MAKIKVGDHAPDFILKNQKGKEVGLKDFIGKKCVVLYFYPKDYSPGCTIEACAFRDSYEIFKKVGAEVIGVSSDSPDSHKRFAKDHNLSFILLSDGDGKIRRRYGAKTLGVLPGRVTFVIDINGVVRHVFSSHTQPKRHIDEALRILKNSGMCEKTS